MSISDANIHYKLVEWMNSLGVCQVIQADEDGDQPPEPYIMVRFTGSAAVRTNPRNIEYANEGTDVRATPVIDTEWRYSVHGFGAYPSDLLRPLRSAIELNQVSEPLFPGLVFHELSQVRNVPEYENEEWQPRAQMDLMLRGLTRDGFLVDVIEQFTFGFEKSQ